MHQLLPLISTSCIVISAIFIAFGWYYILKGRRETHKKLMLTGAFFALSFFIIYVSRTIFIGNTKFGGPENLKTYYLIFLLFHILLATTGGVFGIITLLHAFKARFMKHKRIGRVTAVVWFFTAITGVTVYVLLYLMYPGGETAPVINAIFGL